MTPSETIANYLCARFRSTIRGGALAFDAPLISSGIIDSFGVLELIAFLEEHFGVEIDPARHDLNDFDTVEKIAELVGRLRKTGDRR